MNDENIQKFITEKFPNAVVNSSREPIGNYSFITIKQKQLKTVLTQLKSATSLDVLSCIIGRDTAQEILITYHLESSVDGSICRIRAQLLRDTSELESVKDLWPSAEVFEREVSEMLGVKITVAGAECKQENLFLPEDWEGFPLRKDYVFPESYHGVEHKREPLKKEHPRP